MITSTDNQHIKEIRKLSQRSSRTRAGRFVAEGEELLLAAAAAGWEPVYVLGPPDGEHATGHDRAGHDRAGHDRAGHDRAGHDPAGHAGRPAVRLEAQEQLLRSISGLGSGVHAIGVFEQRWSAPTGPLCVYLHGVGDPGNVGTTIRAAHAFGASCVALGPGCADPYGPKAVRASMGSLFQVALARVRDPSELPGELIALHGGATQPLQGPLTGEATLLIGAERAGLPDYVLAACARTCSIPQAAGDSLNAAMAATVALYEATRMADS